MGRFSHEAWSATAKLRHAIHDMPFNRELAAGTLGRDRFQAYIVQDALYLAQYSRTLAIAAAKAPDAEAMLAFAQSALGAIAVERALHERYLDAFGVTQADLAGAEPAPDCLAYTSFLMATAHQDPFEVLVAALLPCFWIYWDVGTTVARRAAPDNPYRAWIDTYADPGFGDAVRTVIAIADRAGDQASPSTCDRMLAAFRRSAQYEWLFWDGAYHRRGWPDVA